MDEMIARFPRDAAMGGVPGIENKVRGYVNALAKDESKGSLINAAEVSRGTSRLEMIYTDNRPSMVSRFGLRRITSFEAVTPKKLFNSSRRTKTTSRPPTGRSLAPSSPMSPLQTDESRSRSVTPC